MNTKNLSSAIHWVFAVVLALPTAVFAASASDWEGPYVGLHAGYGQDTNVTWDVTGGGSTHRFDMTGYVAGGQVGYNWAAGNVVVLGIEGNASGADVSGDAACPNPSYSCGAKLDQLYTIKGRVGFPLGNFLLYGSLGAASGHISAELKGPQKESDKNYETGWLVGLGSGLAFNNHWNGVIDLQYIDFGKASYTIQNTDLSINNKFFTLMVGGNYKF